MAATRIGISGWTYAPWRGRFFPRGLGRRRELAHAAAQVRTIEIDGTCSSLQRPARFGTWHGATLEDFVFAVKGPRFITHLKRLREAETPPANFFASGMRRLEEKPGPLLWPLPPMLRFDPERLAAFFDRLPRGTREAPALGRLHDHRLKARVRLRRGANRPLRHALEVRHASFDAPEFHRAVAPSRRAGSRRWCARAGPAGGRNRHRVSRAFEPSVRAWRPERFSPNARLTR